MNEEDPECGKVQTKKGMQKMHTLQGKYALCIFAHILRIFCAYFAFFQFCAYLRIFCAYFGKILGFSAYFSPFSPFREKFYENIMKIGPNIVKMGQISKI